MKSRHSSFVRRTGIATLCLSALAGGAIAFKTNPSVRVNAAESEAETIALTGVQMRGVANGWYYYIVFVSDTYNADGFDQNVEGISGYASYFSADAIRLYLSAEDTVGKTLAEYTVQHIGQNIWGQNGSFINFAEYGDNGIDGSAVYKITVEEGCLLPYKKGDTVGAFKTDAHYTFINNGYGDSTKALSSFDWSMTKDTRVTASLTSVQLRGLGDGELAANSWYHYLAICSDSLKGMAAVESSVESSAYASTLSKIRLYRDSGDGGLECKALSELGVNHSERNKWATSSVMFAFDSYKSGWDGSAVYKVTIERGCEIVYESGSVPKKLIVDDDYTFYNSSYGDKSAKFNSLNWGSSYDATVTFDYGVGNTASSEWKTSVSVTDDNPKVAAPLEEGYVHEDWSGKRTLLGWYTDDGTKFDFSSYLTRNVTLHAKWSMTEESDILKKIADSETMAQLYYEYQVEGEDVPTYSISNIGLRFGGMIAKDDYEAVQSHVTNVGIAYSSALPEGKTTLTDAIADGYEPIVVQTSADEKHPYLIDETNYLYSIYFRVSKESISKTVYALAEMTFDNGLTVYLKEKNHSVVSIANEYLANQEYDGAIKDTLTLLSEGRISTEITK